MRGRGGQRGGTSCRTPLCCTTQTFPGLRKTSLRWEKRFGKMQSVMTSVSDVGQAVPIKAQEAHSDTLSLEHIFVSSFVGKQRFFFCFKRIRAVEAMQFGDRKAGFVWDWRGKLESGQRLQFGLPQQHHGLPDM